MNQYDSLKRSMYWVSIPVILILLYGLFEARVLLGSFRLKVDGVENGQITTEPLIAVTGRADHASVVRINNRPIPVNKDGTFEETILLARGINSLSFEAENRFGKTVNKTYTVLLMPEAAG